MVFTRRMTIFRAFGFEVRIDLSWLFIFFFVAWSLAVAFFPFAYEGLSFGAYWAMAIASAIGLFGSVIVHELAHALVARHYGVAMRGITLFIFGGVAEMESEPQSPRAEFFIALAGLQIGRAHV